MGGQGNDPSPNLRLPARRDTDEFVDEVDVDELKPRPSIPSPTASTSSQPTSAAYKPDRTRNKPRTHSRQTRRPRRMVARPPPADRRSARRDYQQTAGSHEHDLCVTVALETVDREAERYRRTLTPKGST